MDSAFFGRPQFYMGNVDLVVQRRLVARKSPPPPSDLTEQLLRIERRLSGVEEEQRQLRGEVEWQGKLLQQPSRGAVGRGTPAP